MQKSLFFLLMIAAINAAAQPTGSAPLKNITIGRGIISVLSADRAIPDNYITVSDVSIVTADTAILLIFAEGTAAAGRINYGETKFGEKEKVFISALKNSKVLINDTGYTGILDVYLPFGVRLVSCNWYRYSLYRNEYKNGSLVKTDIIPWVSSINGVMLAEPT